MYTIPISKEGQREYKIHLITHIFKQMRFLGASGSKELWSEFFDTLYDAPLSEVVQANEVFAEEVQAVTNKRLNNYWKAVYLD